MTRSTCSIVTNPVTFVALSFYYCAVTSGKTVLVQIVHMWTIYGIRVSITIKDYKQLYILVLPIIHESEHFG